MISFLNAAEPVNMENPIPAAEKLINQGLHKEALDLLRPWILDPKTANHQALPSAISSTMMCYINLNRYSEIDEFREKAAEVHKNNWRVL
ncbi:MAG: hypothetical protein LBQ50_00485, partial [Planctomycetaceae bacterium]|nr:hypothetical protein [Planctomycetaceae bacterium]